MQLTYFFDVCSMWCALADEVLAEIQKRYGDRVPITRKIALINDGAPMAAGLEQEQWYYQRCEATTGRRFDHRWIEKRGQSTWLPNALIYASEKLGYGNKVHEALKIAGLTRGEPIVRRDIALQIAVSAIGASQTELENALDDPETSKAISASTAEFNAFAVTQRPTFVIRSEIEDTAIFSGIYRARAHSCRDRCDDRRRKRLCTVRRDASADSELSRNFHENCARRGRTRRLPRRPPMVCVKLPGFTLRFALAGAGAAIDSAGAGESADWARTASFAAQAANNVTVNNSVVFFIEDVNNL